MATRRSFLKTVGSLGTLSALPPRIHTALGPLLAALQGCTASSGYALTPVPFHAVELEDRFWKARLITQKDTLVPFALEKTAPAVENLRRTAAFLQGRKDELPFPHPYIASDLFKVMEGAAYLLKEHRDPKLEQRMDDIIDIIAAAQQEDGYLYEAHITGVGKGQMPYGERPYAWEVHSHETYNMGHMYEAAIAYYQATGKDKWLQVAEKNAQHIHKVFFQGDPNYNDGKPVNQAPGHQELELALVKLYRVTGNRLYLDMAKRFLDIRGITYVPQGKDVMAPTYAQQHLPVAQQREAVGHAVRAAYMYAAMADVGALAGTEEYHTALLSIWHDIVDTKMHITGGLGAGGGIEGFGPAYELPNKEAYNETCAAVGNVLFNFRMFLLTQDAQFLDVAEVALFNNALAGVNLAGNEFFYVNPLEADGQKKFNHGDLGRSPWFGTACCPTNLARLIPQVSGLMYCHDAESIFVTLYGSSHTDIELRAGKVSLRQEAHYPFDGRITLTLTPRTAQAFRLKLRIPTWAGPKQFVPGALYHYVGEAQTPAWELKVNGAPVKAEVEKGFATIERTWQPGDKLTLSLPMPVRLSASIEHVTANRGRVAVTRGPLVYCAEGADNGEPVQQFRLASLPAQSSIRTAIFEQGALAGIVRVELPARKTAEQGSAESPLVLIPYYAWNNRGDGSMLVWLPIFARESRSENNSL